SQDGGRDDREEGDRCGGGAPHDRQRRNQQRPDCPPADRHEEERLTHSAGSTLDACARRYEAPISAVLNVPATTSATGFGSGRKPLAWNALRSTSQPALSSLTGTTPTRLASPRPACRHSITAARDASAFQVN